MASTMPSIQLLLIFVLCYQLLRTIEAEHTYYSYFLMNSPRCGVPDIVKNIRDKRFVLGSRGWRKRHITYYLQNWTPRLGEDTVAYNIQKALDTWGIYGRLEFTRIYNASADIVALFTTGHHGDRYDFDGKGGILAHAFFPYERPGIGGDIHFDADEEWSIHSEESEEGTDFYTVAIHELGHSLGLSHSPVIESIMFPYYKGFNTGVSLDYDDIMGMYELYIRGLPEAHVEVSQSIPRHDTVTYMPPYSSEEEDEEEEGNDKIPPDICEGDFDAVATLREELFIFKKRYVWRLRERHYIESGYPVKFSEIFPFPASITKIDAAYERPDDQTFWVYNGISFVENSPQPLSRYGLPKDLPKVDAVQLWGKNGKTYIYYEERFWRYNEQNKAIDGGYPMHIDRWRGVPENIDGATTWKDGYTYFFKGKYFWKFDNDWIMVTDWSPLPAPQNWLGCPERQFVRDYFQVTPNNT